MTRLDRPAKAELVAGSPTRWAMELGAGALLVNLAPLAIGLASSAPEFAADFAWRFLTRAGPALLLVAASAAGLGFVAPRALQILRKGVPLWLLIPLAGALGASVGWIAAGLVDVPDTWRVMMMVQCGVAATIGALPYTMASVLRRPTWPAMAVAVGCSAVVTAVLSAYT